MIEQLQNTIDNFFAPILNKLGIRFNYKIINSEINPQLILQVEQEENKYEFIFQVWNEENNFDVTLVRIYKHNTYEISSFKYLNENHDLHSILLLLIKTYFI